MSKKKENPSFTLQLPLKPNISDISALDKYFELSRKLYNVLLNEALKRFNLMRQSKQYQNIKSLPKKDQSKAYIQAQQDFLFTKNDMIKFATPIRVNEFKQIDSNTVQKLAQCAYNAVFKMQIGKAKHVYFKRKGEMDSVEGASNRQGIKYRDGYLEWNKLRIPIVIKNNDTYAQEALAKKIKFCRIVRKIVRGKTRYFLQLILDGIPPRKIDKGMGMFKNRHGKGKVGIDIGTQTIAISSDKEVKLLELAPEVQNIEREKRLIQRKMDRSKRATNPHKFNDDGTNKKDNREKWMWSKNYLKLRSRLRELQRKQANIRKQSHYRLTNWIVSLGNEFYVEKMNYQGLQKRAKETTVNEKTGKYNKKKRFGKSLANKAPSMLLTLLKQKLKYWDLTLNEIDTFSFKASQYNHITDDYVKCGLSDRWKVISDKKVQRDLYSAFLIMNSDEKLKNADRELCENSFGEFFELHNIEIECIKTCGNKLISSMGI